MAITVYLEGGGKVINLNQLLDHEEGAQVIAGLTGFGLPPVQVQWLDGAGDGSKPRGKRVLARPIDLPLFFASKSRRVLKDLARNLAIALADEATLRISDTDESFDWVAQVWRTGGGDFSYGEDTDGETSLSWVVTVQAGNPYWIQDRTVLTVSASSGTIRVYNPGSAPAYPIWNLVGPGVGYSITSPTGDRITYDALIDVGKSITIDTEAGTIVDQDGVNSYAGVFTTPRMFTIPPGWSDIAIVTDNSSATFLAAQANGRVNYETNPNLDANADDWTLSGSFTTAYDGTHKTIAHAEHLYTSADKSGILCYATITGLTPGKPYRAVLNGTAGPKGTIPAFTTLAGRNEMVLRLRNGGTGIGFPLAGQVTVPANTTKTLDVTFVATGTEATFEVTSGFTQVRSGTGAISTVSEKVTVTPPFYMGDPGDVFDGDSTDTAEITYAWTGDDNDSTSVAVAVLGDDVLAQTAIFSKTQPRDWMVV